VTEDGHIREMTPYASRKRLLSALGLELAIADQGRLLPYPNFLNSPQEMPSF
jgi:hypothetical protein